MIKNKKFKRIVIKIGTSLLTKNNNTEFNINFIKNIISEISILSKTKQIALVSSGAIGLGMKELNLKKRPKKLSDKQAVAAIGQPLLMNIYSKYFSEYNIRTAQVLLTHSGLQNRKRHLNATNTINSLFKYNVIPIINENDTVATEEIKFGDNDTLASLVSILIDADLMILLTDTDGLYKNINDSNTIINEVYDITEDIVNFAKPTLKENSVGGFLSKLESAKISINSGVGVLICNGNKPNQISEFMSNKKIGTYFYPKKYNIKGKKRYIAFNLKRRGKIHIDEGAGIAISQKGKSLLPSGIIKVESKFDTGDCVSIFYNNKEIACGLVNYNSIIIDKTKKLTTSQIRKIFPNEWADDEIIHRDNMVLLSN